MKQTMQWLLSGQRYYRTAPNSITKIYFNYTVFIRFQEKVYFDGFAGLGFRVGGEALPFLKSEQRYEYLCILEVRRKNSRLLTFITNALRYNFVNLNVRHSSM